MKCRYKHYKESGDSYMPLNRLDNCRICGKLYLKDHTDYCLDCYKEVELEYKTVIGFLKIEKNRNATIEEVREFTDVSLTRIADFIREGRIYAEDYPNLGYPCAHCGKVIKRQMLCDNCFNQFTSDVDKTLKRDKLLDAMDSNQQVQSKNPQYWKLRK